MTLFAKNAKNPTCAISAQVEGTTLTGWAEHYARQGRKDGSCPTCNDTGEIAECVHTLSLDRPCPTCRPHEYQRPAPQPILTPVQQAD